MEISTIGSWNNRSPRDQQQAFTLLELIVVVALISIMLALAIPDLRSGLLTDELRSTTRKLIGTVKSLRNQAVREQQDYLLHFNMAEKRIWYERRETQKDSQKDARQENKGITLPSSIRILDIWTKSEGMNHSESVTLWISRKGYMDETIIHMGDDEDTLSVFFTPFMATIKVLDGYMDPESMSD